MCALQGVLISMSPEIWTPFGYAALYTLMAIVSGVCTIEDLEALVLLLRVRAVEEAMSFVMCT